MSRRPAAAVPRRRPAAAPAAAAEPPRRRGRVDPVVPVRSGDERYNSAEEVSPLDVSPGGFGRGDWLLIKGVYYQQDIEAAGKVQKEEFEAGERELFVELTGTSNEDLLKFGSGTKPPLVKVHLCGAECHQRRENPNLIHAKKVKKLSPDAPCTWEKNLVNEDEVAALREDRADWLRREKEKEDKKEVRSSSSSRGKKKKKKKRKAKKKEEDDKPSGSKTRKKMGGKAQAKKDLAALYSGTGLDPCLKDRRRLARKTKRALRKTSATSSSTSTSSSSTASMGDDTGGILQDRSKPREPKGLSFKPLSQEKQWFSQRPTS